MVLTLSRQFVTLTGTGKAVRVFFFFWIRLSWSKSLVMARKSPWEFLLAVYINFDRCSLLDTTSVIVSMILAAKKMRLVVWTENQSVGRHCERWSPYPLICSVTLSPFLSPRLRAHNLFYIGLALLLQTKEGTLAYTGDDFSFLDFACGNVSYNESYLRTK